MYFKNKITQEGELFALFTRNINYRSITTNAFADNSTSAMITVTSTSTVYFKVTGGANAASLSEKIDWTVAGLGRAWVIVRKYQ